MKTERKERVSLGILGALLGSILGSAFIVIEGQAAGVFSLISGVVMAVCTLQGYSQLAGRLSKRGAIISLGMMAVMICLANQVNCTIEIMEMVEELRGRDFLEVFGAFGELLEVQKIRSWYHWQLALLYLFALGGSLPILARTFRKPKVQTEARRRAAVDETLLGRKPEPAEEKPELQGTLYPFCKAWMKPMRISVGGFIMALAVLLVALLTLTPILEEYFQADLRSGMIAGCFLSCIPMVWITLTITRQCNLFQILYVRAAGRLWRVNLMKFCRVGDWEILPPARQAVIQDDILWELENILNGDFSARRSGAITELQDIQAERESRWSWTISYQTEAGTRKKLKIPKGYPNLAPAVGMEQAQGPAPYRWIPGLAALALAAVFLGGSLALDQWRMLKHQPTVMPSIPVQTEPDAPEFPVRVPETITEYVISEIRFQMDADFQYSRRRFVDSKTGTSYRVSTQYGVDEADAWDTLTEHVQSDDPLYDRFQAVYPGEDLLAPLNETAKFNIVSVYRLDGTVRHTAAALSNTGILFTLEAEDTGQPPEEVLENLMYTLKSVRFEGPEVTEENYQTQIHLSEIRNCVYMATAYIKTDLFGHEAFVDVYVPYSGAPIYAANGRAIRTEAHGLRVYASILPGENAKEVIEARQQVLASTGQLYEDGVDDQTYREDMDAACMLTVYEENGQKRNTVLYAESMWEGYYLLREITGLPEQMDEDYLPLLKELEGIFGLTMPVLEQLGE